MTEAQRKDVRFKVTELFKPKKGGQPGNSNAAKTNAQDCAFVSPEDPKGQTQTEAAKVLGVSRRTVQKWDKADNDERVKAVAEHRDPLPPSQRVKEPRKPRVKPEAPPSPEPAPLGQGRLGTGGVERHPAVPAPARWVE